MTRSVLLGSVYAVFLTCSLLSLLFGETGVTALARLAELNRRLESNLDDLHRKRGNLISRLTDMRSDSEAIWLSSTSTGIARRKRPYASQTMRAATSQATRPSAQG